MAGTRSLRSSTNQNASPTGMQQEGHSGSRGGRGGGHGRGRGRGGHAAPTTHRVSPDNPPPPPSNSNSQPPAPAPNPNPNPPSTPSSISATNSSTDSANVDELNRRIKELLARATQAEQALVQQVQQHANAAAGGINNSPALIPRPHGSAGDGFSLQNAMGLQNDRVRYKAIQRMIKSLVDRAGIASMTQFRHIEPLVLGKIHRIARQREPYLARFQHNWATDEFIVMLLKSRRKTARRHQTTQQNLEDMDLAASAASAANQGGASASAGVGTGAGADSAPSGSMASGSGMGGGSGGNGAHASGGNDSEWSD